MSTPVCSSDLPFLPVVHLYGLWKVVCFTFFCVYPTMKPFLCSHSKIGQKELTCYMRWDPDQCYTLLLSFQSTLATHINTHAVSCTINALVSSNYPLHQSLSSAINQGTTSLWGSPAWPPAGILHLISGLPGCLVVGAQLWWLRTVHRVALQWGCSDRNNDINAVDQWMMLWALHIRFCHGVKGKNWFGF